MDWNGLSSIESIMEQSVTTAECFIANKEDIKSEMGWVLSRPFRV